MQLSRGRRLLAALLVSFTLMSGATAAWAQREKPFDRRDREQQERGGGLGRQAPSPVEQLHRKAQEAMRLRDFEEARRLFEEELALMQARLGPDHRALSLPLTGLAEALAMQGALVEAEAAARRSLSLREDAVGADRAPVANSLNVLGRILRRERRLPEAEALHRRALAIYETLFGPRHPEVATSLYHLAECLRGQARFAEAEEAHRRALALREEKTLDGEGVVVVASLTGLADVLRATARYEEAEDMLRRALAIREREAKREHPEVASILASLGAVLQAQAKSGEAKTVLRRALGINEKFFGPEHQKVAEDLDLLGQVLRSEAQFAEAEPILRRALTIRERALPPDHPLVGASLTSLAMLLGDQARYAEAEALLRRGVAIREKVLGPEHPVVAAGLLPIAEILREQRHMEEAEILLRRVVAIREKAFGAEHPGVAAVLVTYGMLLDRQGRLEEAATALERAVAIQEKTLAQDHPHLAGGYNALASVRRAQVRMAEAEALARRAIAIRSASLGAKHPSLALAFSNLALILRDEKRLPEAVDASRQAVQILDTRYIGARSDRSEGGEAERLSRRPIFARHVDLLAALSAAQPRRLSDAADEGFRAMQMAGETRTANAVAGMAARFAAGDDKLAALIRERQDLVERWRVLDRDLLATISESRTVRDASIEQRVRKEMAELDRRIAKIDRGLASDFPRFAEIASPSPLALAEVQALLGPQEALISWLIEADRGFVVAVRKDRIAFSTVPLTSGQLLEAVATLRAGLEPPSTLRSAADLPTFDTGAAHALYAKLFGSVEPLFAEARHLFVVLDGALQSLPLGVLVTEPPAGVPGELADYAAVPWLARKTAISVLPAVTSLRALRLFAERSKATRSFAGFGDPLFTEPAGSIRSARLGGLFRGGLADVDALRRLPRLPETAIELKAQAAALKAPASSMHLGAAASEAVVKEADLQDVRVIVFATHGLIAGDIDGLTEPALALTPPQTASPLNDGLLTASEVARLRLNADWLVLSACNTAAADGSEGASGLSGLAKAFFFAGARSLLVSHWPVNSAATVDLTTGAFRALEADPAIGRAEALRRSMLQMIDGAAGRTEARHYAHPMFWAPFVLVGEGAAGR